jgi:hypothetical protein
MTKPLDSYVAHFGLTVGLVRARDEPDVRRRVRELHPGFVIGDDEIAVRRATADDERLLDQIQTGSNEYRVAWGRRLAPVEADGS